MGKSFQSGFTLVEMTVVLIILGLMLGWLLMPLEAQIDQKKIQETRVSIAEIKEALIGFAMINGRFPCPATVTDPASADFGVETVPCPTAATSEGYLPWKTLGVIETDAWGDVQKTSAGGMAGYWRYRVDRNFSVAFDMTTAFSVDALKVQDSAGSALTTTTERPVAIIYSTGKNRLADGENADYEVSNGVYESDVQSTDFDDHLAWISRPLLMNRMVTAGKLP
jgi:prepilin-type N-terminal cleavage/methylation domain-containing protein